MNNKNNFNNNDPYGFGGSFGSDNGFNTNGSFNTGSGYDSNGSSYGSNDGFNSYNGSYGSDNGYNQNGLIHITGRMAVITGLTKTARLIPAADITQTAAHIAVTKGLIHITVIRTQAAVHMKNPC